LRALTNLPPVEHVFGIVDFWCGRWSRTKNKTKRVMLREPNVWRRRENGLRGSNQRTVRD